MSTRVYSRRPTKRIVEGACSQAKMVLDVDLNDYPDDIPASSWLPLETSDTTVSPTSQVVSSQRGVTRQDTAPIDVDAIDDDVVFVSASTRVNQSSNQSGGTSNPVMVVLDEDLDAQRVFSGAIIEDPVTISSEGYDPQNGNLPGRDTIICDTCENLDNTSNIEKCPTRRDASISVSEYEMVTAKEPTFSCAVCLGRLVNETSTTCGHIFCEVCIKTAIKSQKKCPACRCSLNMKKIHRVYLPTSTQ